MSNSNTSSLKKQHLDDTPIVDPSTQPVADLNSTDPLFYGPPMLPVHQKKNQAMQTWY